MLLLTHEGKSTLLLIHEKVKKFRIAWRSKLTGYTGHGEYCLTEQGAMDWLRYSNRNFPEIFHWIEPPHCK